MTHPSLEPHRFYRADPVARFLLEKVRVSPVMLALLSIAITASSAIFIAWISRTLPSQPEEFTGLFEDPVPWVLILFINPVVIGYYLWSFQAIDKVIIDLEKSDAIEIEVSEINRISQAAYRKKWRRLMAIASAIIFSIFVFKTRFGLTASWTGSGTLPALAATAATFIVVYLGSLLVLNLIANVWILHRVFETKELNVNPLHPDRCGGLRSLSNYALKTAYLAGILGLLVGLIEYHREFGSNIGTPTSPFLYIFC